MIFNSSYRFLGDSLSGTALKGKSTKFDYKLEDNLMVYGAELIFQNAAFGDYVSFAVVDKDNLLGYGADFIVAEWIRKWYVPYLDYHWKVVSEFTGTTNAGLYIRLTYTSVSQTDDTSIMFNLYMITPE
jgi:hypothetical protein